jgi:hypothetical protein
MTRRGLAVLAGGVCVAVLVAFFVRQPVEGPTPAVPALALDSTGLAPEGERIRVQVLNGTDIDGLARRGMRQLRDYGYDVVDYKTSTVKTDTTLIEVDALHRATGERVRRALNAGVVRAREQASPYLDVTVTLGADWKPAPQPFRP